MRESTDYRGRIYAQYGRRFQDAPEELDIEGARRWGRAFDHYFRGWLPRHSGAPIVDLACGAGRLLQFFVDRGYSDVTGVDISPDQVRRSRKVVPRVEQANVLDHLARHHQA